MDRESKRFRQERKTMEAMVQIYCEGHHGPASGTICESCATLLAYSLQRLERCPFGSGKPKCSACTVHCYKPDMRQAVRDVMRYAGPRMLTKHPVLAARHLMQPSKPKQKAPSS